MTIYMGERGLCSTYSSSYIAAAFTYNKDLFAETVTFTHWNGPKRFSRTGEKTIRELMNP